MATVSSQHDSPSLRKRDSADLLRHHRTRAALRTASADQLQTLLTAARQFEPWLHICGRVADLVSHNRDELRSVHKPRPRDTRRREATHFEILGQLDAYVVADEAGFALAIEPVVKILATSDDDAYVLTNELIDMARAGRLVARIETAMATNARSATSPLVLD